jgi:hypothetical protein
MICESSYGNKVCLKSLHLHQDWRYSYSDFYTTQRDSYQLPCTSCHWCQLRPHYVYVFILSNCHKCLYVQLLQLFNWEFLNLCILYYHMKIHISLHNFDPLSHNVMSGIQTHSVSGYRY